MTWRTAPLGDVAPAKPLRSTDVTDEAPVWQVTLDHIESNTGLLLQKNVRPYGEAGNSTHWFDDRHVLYSKLRPYLNKVLLPDELGLGTTELVPLCPVPGTLDRKYLAYYLRTKKFVNWVSGQIAGAKMPRVSMKVFWGHEIPLPSLKEQKRIAAILDKADDIRRKRQQAIQLADEFLRSVFLDIFGDPVTNSNNWDEVALDQIATIRSGVTKGRKFNGKPTVMLPYMRVANVQDGRIDLSDVQSIELLEDEVERFLLKAGDLLLTEGGDPDKLGRGAVWHNEITPCVHQNHIFAVRVDQDIILPEFLSTQIGSQRGKRYFLKVGKQTTGIATINKTVLSAYPALVPPIQLQKKYVDIVERTRGHERKHQKLDFHGAELFHSVSQRAFRGDL